MPGGSAPGSPPAPRPAAEAARAIRSPRCWPVCVYGGYFGAGVGVLMLGVLSVGTGGDYRSANVTKNLVSSLNSLTAAIIFAAQGVVAWPATLVMIAGTLAGALVGARFAQVMPNQAARGLVVVRRRVADRRVRLALLVLAP